MADEFILRKNEINFILWACHTHNGFLDFDNNSDSEFKNAYGFSKDEADLLKKSLEKKLNPQKKKIPLR